MFMSDRTEIGLCRINHWFCYGYQKLGTLGFFTSFWGEILSKMQSIWSTLTQNTINTHFLIKNISIKIVQHLTCWHPRWNLMRTGATLVCPSIILTSFLSWVYWNMHSLSNSILCCKIPENIVLLELEKYSLVEWSILLVFCTVEFLQVDKVETEVLILSRFKKLNDVVNCDLSLLAPMIML